MKRILPLILLLAACREEGADILPGPVVMTDDAVGHFCMMTLSEMDGPKAQIHLDGVSNPIFFSQVRDGVAYLLEPEKTSDIKAFYVSDLSVAPSWDAPGAANWIAAADAYFVVGAAVTGGMGAPELAPFGDAADAAAFAAEKGGAVMRLDDIPADAVLGAVEHAETKGMDG